MELGLRQNYMMMYVCGVRCYGVARERDHNPPQSSQLLFIVWQFGNAYFGELITIPVTAHCSGVIHHFLIRSQQELFSSVHKGCCGG